MQVSSIVIPNAHDLVAKRTQVLGPAATTNSTKAEEIKSKFKEEREVLLKCGQEVLPLVIDVLDALFKKEGNQLNQMYTAGQIQLADKTYHIQEVLLKGDFNPEDYQNGAWKNKVKHLGFNLMYSLGAETNTLSLAIQEPITENDTTTISQLRIASAVNHGDDQANVTYCKNISPKHPALISYPSHFNANEELITADQVQDNKRTCSYLNEKAYLARMGY